MLSWWHLRFPTTTVVKHRRHAALTCCKATQTGRRLQILGIESSCDDTGVAVVTCNGEILGESLATQTEIHAAWGGVVPKLAEEAHAAAIDRCVSEALRTASLQPVELSAVAVTVGPGLSLCLRVGVAKAQQIARQFALPLVPIHHMEAHALVARMFDTAGAVRFPFLCLLVSGGHNLLLLVYGVGQYRQLGTTMDDALGEAYDKVARLLGLELVPSGGAALEALALQGDHQRYAFPVPLRLRNSSCNFSYAGLKTAVRMAVERELGDCPADAPLQTRADIAASFQRVAVEHLAMSTARAAKWAKESYPELQSLVVAGGVAANKVVRSRLQEVAAEHNLQLVCPPAKYCTDNGVMVAWAGVERYRLGLWTPPPPQLYDAAIEQDSNESECRPVALSSAAATLRTTANQGATTRTSSCEGTAVQATASADGPSEVPQVSPRRAADSQAGPQADEQAPGNAARTADGVEWVQLHPRWPLTSEVDGRSEPPLRSARKKRLHVDLTTLTRQQLQHAGRHGQQLGNGEDAQALAQAAMRDSEDAQAQKQAAV